MASELTVRVAVQIVLPGLVWKFTDLDFWMKEARRDGNTDISDVQEHLRSLSVLATPCDFLHLYQILITGLVPHKLCVLAAAAFNLHWVPAI